MHKRWIGSVLKQIFFHEKELSGLKYTFSGGKSVGRLFFVFSPHAPNLSNLPSFHRSHRPDHSGYRQIDRVLFCNLRRRPAYGGEAKVMYHIGPTRLFLTLPLGEPLPNDKFDPKRIGLEHFAIGITSVEDLKEIEKVLNEGSITHSGIHIDKHSGKEKIWLDDPDNAIRVEFFT